LTNKNKNKPTIKKIVFTKDELDEIDNIKKGQAVPKTKTVTNKKSGYSYEYTTNRKFSFLVGRKRMIKLYGGVCTACGNWPEYKVLYDRSSKDQGAKLIQRYCQSCFSKWEEMIKR
jgi:hypothetical protein